MTAPDPVEDTAAALQTALAALRSQGAQQLDPAGFHYLEVLLQRLPTQPNAVRHILQGRLQQALADYTQRFTQAHAAASDVVQKLSRQHPERTLALRRLLALGDTKTIHHMAQTTAAVATTPPPTPLAQLVQLNQHSRAARQPDDAPAAATAQACAKPIGSAVPLTVDDAFTTVTDTAPVLGSNEPDRRASCRDRVSVPA